MPCPPGSGPCEVWELNLICLSPSGTISGADPCNLLDGEPVPQEIIDNATLIASQLLWSLTGRQFSVCQTKLRPCRPEDCDQSFSGYEGYPFYPVHQVDGTWINQACGCQDSCSCENLCEVRLPYPVCSVDEVKIDGEILLPTEYRVLDFERLVYSPSATGIPGGCWPRCNQLSKPDTEVGTWSVSLTYGRPVPELVLLGASEMACEIIKSFAGKPCKLPQRVSSITRQGVSVSFLDTMDFLGEGLTGLYFVDLAIRTYNPKRLARRPAVYSPDVKGKWNLETWKYGDPVSILNPGVIDGGNP